MDEASPKNIVRLEDKDDTNQPDDNYDTIRLDTADAVRLDDTKYAAPHVKATQFENAPIARSFHFQTSLGLCHSTIQQSLHFMKSPLS